MQSILDISIRDHIPNKSIRRRVEIQDIIRWIGVRRRGWNHVEKKLEVSPNGLKHKRPKQKGHRTDQNGGKRVRFPYRKKKRQRIERMPKLLKNIILYSEEEEEEI